MYAVDPAQVRENAEKLTADEICVRLFALLDDPPDGMWVTLSGGNPALMDFDIAADALVAEARGSFIIRLHRDGFRVAVETQGSVWREWLRYVDHLTVSPKPPSSGMVTTMHTRQSVRFIDRAEQALPRKDRSLKIVIFDDEDYDWARQFFLDAPDWDTFLSVGTDQDIVSEHEEVQRSSAIETITDRYAWLCEKVAADPVMRNTRVMPQLHVLAWGMKRAV